MRLKPRLKAAFSPPRIPHHDGKPHKIHHGGNPPIKFPCKIPSLSRSSRGENIAGDGGKVLGGKVLRGGSELREYSPSPGAASPSQDPGWNSGSGLRQLPGWLSQLSCGSGGGFGGDSPFFLAARVNPWLADRCSFPLASPLESAGGKKKTPTAPSELSPRQPAAAQIYYFLAEIKKNSNIK